MTIVRCSEDEIGCCNQGGGICLMEEIEINACDYNAPGLMCNKLNEKMEKITPAYGSGEDYLRGLNGAHESQED